MNDLQIDYFMAVGTNLSFTKTSQELYVSQPAISKQIKLMEEELGVRLFYRNNKKTELTEAGKLFYEFFGNYKAGLKNVKEKAVQLQERERRTLKIGFMEGWDLTLILPELNRRMQETFPGIQIEIDCGGIKDLEASLLNGRLDIVMTLHNSLYDIDDLECRDIMESRKILMYSSKWSSDNSIKPAISDFKDKTFVAPSCIMNSVIERIITSYCRPFGFTPEIKFVHNFEAMITYVRNDMGVAFADCWNWAKHSHDIKYFDVDIQDKICVVTIARDSRPVVETASRILEEITVSNKEKINERSS